jgi:hypothetical protein
MAQGGQQARGPTAGSARARLAAAQVERGNAGYGDRWSIDICAHESVMGRRRTWQVAAVVVLAGVATGSLWIYVTDRGSQSEPGPEAVDHPGSMRTISSAPLAPRVRTHAAWSGEELLVWSGVQPGDATDEAFDVVDDGAAYDPTTDSWRTLPTAPISGRAGAAAVWAGDRLIVWGGFSRPDAALDDGAAYLPDQDAWVELPAAPITGRGDATAVWTGHEVLIVGGAERAGRPGQVSGLQRDGAAYDPVANQWRLLPPIPDGVWQLRDRGVGPIRERFASTWAGEALFIWGRDVALYHPGGDAWERITAPPTAMWLGSRVTAVRIGDQVAVIGLAHRDDPETFGITYRPAGGAFGTVPGLSSRTVMSGPRQVAAAGDLVVLLGAEPASAAVWRPGDPAWRTIPADLVRGLEAAVAWTGEELLIWGGSDGTGPRTDGIAWTP